MGSTNRVKSLKTYWSNTITQIWNIGAFLYGKLENDKITMSIHCILKTKLFCWHCIKKYYRTEDMHGYWILFFLSELVHCVQLPIQNWVLISRVSSCNWNRNTVLVSTLMFSVLMIRMEKKHTGTLLWRIWLKFKMATDEMFFVIVLKTSTWLDKHFFVYLYMYMLLPYQPVINDTQCSQSNVGITPSFNWHIESYWSSPRYTLVSGSPGKWNHKFT